MTALANALQVMPDQRTPSFERLRAELSAAPTITATIEEPELLEGLGDAGQPEKKKEHMAAWVLIPCALALVVFTAVGVLWLSNGGLSFQNMSQEASAKGAAPASLPEDSDAPAMASLTSPVPAAPGDKIEVPDLVGQNYNSLTKVVSSGADYQIVRASEEFSDADPEGEILSQSPAAGEEMERGGSIVVVVSKGAEIRTLPSILGKTLADASTTVTAAGFVPTKTENYSDIVPAGSAIGYEGAEEGSKLPYGTQVVIVISKGPEGAAASSELPASGGEGESSIAPLE